MPPPTPPPAPRPPAQESPWRPWQLLAVVTLVALITALHYGTATHEAASHNVFRRLYYLPIVWAAFLAGWRGGLTAAAVTTLAYLPHAFFMPHHLDPAGSSDKLLEILLYFAVGGLTGTLVDRQHRAQRRAAQERVRRARAEAAADRLQGLVHLTRGLAHELRNPLGGIQGAIEILSTAVPASHPAHEMASVGLRETTRLNRVLTDFLQFARPRDPVVVPFDPCAVARDVTTLLSPDAQAAGVHLALESPSRCPPALGDAEQIQQVLVNLVRNALQATAARGTHVTVQVCAPGRADRVTFQVADDGPGVPPELGDSIFDPYVTSRGGDGEGGTGLGLSIAALLVQAQGGTLSHRPNPETPTGALFQFDLPVASTREATAPLSPDAADAADAAPAPAAPEVPA